MSYDYRKIIIPYRIRQTTIPNRYNLEEFYSDRSRITYSSSFRRLQQKAQVFPLEPNSSVRTRLTHSLEVADLGRTLALEIANELHKKDLIDKDMIQEIVAIVVNACLLHDIGNPPFGHFGEEAIKRWFSEKWEDCAIAAGVNREILKDYITDFTQFDGNPQGLRIILRLHCERNESGLNLTLPTILSSIKYTRSTDEPCNNDIKKKPGYFQTEKPIIEKLYKVIEWDREKRFPLVYIMEAADDIAYCLSDISDGIEKKIITAREFIHDIEKAWKQKYEDEKFPIKLPQGDIEYFNIVCVDLSKCIMAEAVNNYINNHDIIFSGTAKNLINEDGMGRVLKIINNVARNKLYRSQEAENIELSGYKIITGLLKHFSYLLRLKREKFELFIDETKSPQGQGIDLEWRLFNRISKRCIKSYNYQINEFKADNEMEWFLRAHLILDHISNMTDDYALAIYQMLEGISC